MIKGNLGRVLAFAVVASVLQQACGSTEPVKDMSPATIVGVSSLNQRGTPGSAAETRPSVKVTNAPGSALVGVNVTFAVATGGGTVSGASVTTDASGVATVGAWTLGAVAGENTVTATVSGLTPVTFSATTVPQTIASLSASPMSAALWVGDQATLGATARDANGKLVASAVIGWTSSDPNIATVSSSGVVVGKSDGNVVITISADTFTAKAQLQVNGVAGAVNVKLSNKALFPYQEEPTIAIDGERLYAGWKEMSAPAGINRVAFSGSANGGLTWSAPVLMEGGEVPGYGASDPSIVVDNAGTVFYARVHTTKAAPWVDPWRIVVSSSTTLGATWSSPIRADLGSSGVDKPALHSSADGTLYLAYVHLTTTVNEIEVSRSRDHGINWEGRTTMPNTADLSNGPAIVGSGDTARVAWWSRPKDNIFLSSFAYGQAPSTSTRVNDDNGSVRFVLSSGLVLVPGFPSMVRQARGRLLVGWPNFSGNDWNVVVGRSDDGGQSWSAPVRVNDAPANKQWMMALATGSDGTVHAAWYDARSGDTHVAYAKSIDGGVTWSRNVRVTSIPTVGTTSRLGDYLSLVADGSGNAYVVWTDGRGGLDIYFAKIAVAHQPREKTK